jgi:hypothetical protein
MRRSKATCVLTAFMLIAAAGPAAAKSEKDRDTDARHERARESSRDNDADDDAHHHHHDRCWNDCYTGPTDSYDDPNPNYTEARATSADLAVGPKVGLDHPGAGFSLELGFPYFAVGEAQRRGLVWQFDLGYGRWLDDYRPEGALYTSTMDLLRISTSLNYRYTWLGEMVNVSLSGGPGFLMIRAMEHFDDTADSLNETLVAGAVFGGGVRLELNGGLFGGKVFLEGGVSMAAAWVSPYLEDYDSVVRGLGAFMLMPRVGAGHYWELTSGVELGLAYELETVGGISAAPSWAHAVSAGMRFSTYVME